MMLWIIIFAMLILFLFSFIKYETFSDIVGYNNSQVMDSSISTPYDTQNVNLQKLLDDANKLNPKITDTSEGILYNSNIKFPLEEAFKGMIRDYLIKNKILSDRIAFTSGIDKMYINSSNIHSFNITVTDRDTFVSRTLKVKINGNTMEINSIELSTVKEEPSIESIDALNPNYYEIYNKYHLMDPFLTSGKKMIITNTMKSTFDKIVEQKKLNKDTEYHSYI